MSNPGTDGAVSVAGTLAGLVAAAIVAGAGSWALRGGWILFTLSCAGAVFGLFFDSLLGATLEKRGWLNNDAVNFLSTASAAGFALLLLAFVPLQRDRLADLVPADIADFLTPLAPPTPLLLNADAAARTCS